jgi:hypothetical protein
MADQSKPSVFSWFKTEDYIPVGGFKLADWAAMLRIRWNYEVQWLSKTASLSAAAIDELQKDGPIKADEYWTNYLNDALPRNYSSGVPRGTMPPPLQDITALLMKQDNDIYSGLKSVTNFFHDRILRVSPSAPDNALTQAFAEWLQELRKFDPLPVSRRGPHATNVSITDQHLKSWTEYKVLAVIDLDFCATVFGVSKLSHEALCDLLLPPEKEVGPKDWGREARRKAEEAKESLDLLTAQARFEQSPPDKQPGGTN